MNNIKIRDMHLDDLDAIKDSLCTNFDSFWNYNILKNELCSDNSFYFVALKNNIIIGFAGIKVILDECEIMNIVVHKSYRNSGIGNLLLEHLILMAKKYNTNIIHLEVSSNNFAAIKLYQKHKFEKVGFRKNYYNYSKDSCNVTDSAILMDKKLY